MTTEAAGLPGPADPAEHQCHMTPRGLLALSEGTFAGVVGTYLVTQSVIVTALAVVAALSMTAAFIAGGNRNHAGLREENS